MKDVLKKVVILEHLASPYVHQAIIVMRDYEPRLESQAVLDAERIVNSYLDNMKLKSGCDTRRHARKRHKKSRAVWTAIIIMLLLSAAAALLAAARSFSG